MGRSYWDEGWTPVDDEPFRDPPDDRNPPEPERPDPQDFDDTAGTGPLIYGFRFCFKDGPADGEQIALIAAASPNLTLWSRDGGGWNFAPLHDGYEPAEGVYLYTLTAISPPVIEGGYWTRTATYQHAPDG